MKIHLYSKNVFVSYSYLTLGLICGSCPGDSVRRFLMISAGSLILGILGLLGDMVCPSSYRGISFTETTVVGAFDCHTHLDKWWYTINLKMQPTSTFHPNLEVKLSYTVSHNFCKESELHIKSSHWDN